MGRSFVCFKKLMMKTYFCLRETEENKRTRPVESSVVRPTHSQTTCLKLQVTINSQPKYMQYNILKYIIEILPFLGKKILVNLACLHSKTWKAKLAVKQTTAPACKC